MGELQERLQSALADRYAIRREIGRGGMATVYLADDIRHQRQVALKAFHPELAAGDGIVRFLREIAVAARLTHPNILPLFESGEVGGLPWYTMPYIEGESLATRLDREGQLPIPEAIRITSAVAAGLQHAHDQKVIHRDIKPDNILLSGDGVFIADFGIAHALDTLGSERLTATGLAVGTPTYMSPEQITGAVALDGRADVYSLGCVLYNMLAGEPPFGGTSMQAILARHLAEEVPRLRVVRNTVPTRVEAAVVRALAKAPVDRFATAVDFATELAAAAEAPDVTVQPRRHASRRVGWAIAAVAIVVLGGLMAWIRPWSLTRRAGTGPLDRQLMVVAPFEVAGAPDAVDDALATQLPTLIAQRLPGGGGPRAIAIIDRVADSPRARHDAAQRAGAGLILQGSLTRTDGRLVLSASLRSGATDSLLAQVLDERAPADSLPALLDHTLSQLLIGTLPITAEKRASLTRLSLDLLREYLAATNAFTRGRTEEAAEGFAAVLAADSAVYPAAFWLGSIGIVTLDQVPSRAALLRARTDLDRMAAIDTIQLRSLQLWRDDNPNLRLGALERLGRLEFAATTSTEAVPWYILGERLFHDGPFLGIPDMLRRAAESFARALEVEPDFVPALGHAIDLAAARDDTATVRSLAPRYFALDSVGDLSDYYRWRVAVALDDADALREIRAALDDFPSPSLERIVDVAQLDGVAIPDAIAASTALWSRSGASSEARWAFVKQRELALNRGRPQEAASILTRWRSTGVPFRPRDGLAEVVDALYWGADTVAAAAWVREATPTVEQFEQAGGGAATGDDEYLRCGVNLWRVSRGAAPLDRSIRRQPGAGVPIGTTDGDMQLCTAVVGTRHAERTGAPDARARLAHLDSLVSAVPPALTWLITAANLTAAELWEREGDLPRALTASRRRVYITDINESRVLVALSTMLREEGRLAALAGDTAGARVAYRRYLALRDDPEPSVAAEVARVREALAALGTP
jgi:serine/threonine-protein kinase